MRAFACPVCHSFIAFESRRCTTCHTHVGLHLPTRTMVATEGDTASVDGQRWVRCTQASVLGCNWLTPEDQQSYQRGRCVADALIRNEPVSDDTLAREKLKPTAKQS